MAKTSAAAKRVPKTVSKPTTTAAAVADVAAVPAVEPVTAIGSVGIPKRAARKAKAAAPAPTPAADKPAKAHKPKLVRDSFTIPKDEYQVLDALKRRALGLEHHVRKSELLRAGIRTLAAMNDKALLKALRDVPTLKTGRPKAA